MQVTDNRRYDMLVRSGALGAQHRDVIEGVKDGAQMLADLDRFVAEIKEHFASQASGQAAAREGTSARAEARLALRRTLASMSGIARTLGTTGLDEKFRIPRQIVRDQELVAIGQAFARDAAPLVNTFVARGLVNGIDGLTKQIQALEQAIARQTAGKEAHVGAGVGIKAAFASAKNAVEALDVIMVNGLRRDPQKLAVWKNARRIGPSRLKEAAVVVPLPAPAPATPEPAKPTTVTKVA